MLLVWKLLVSAVSILSLLALCQAAGSRPNCDFPPIDIPSQKIDVLGDLEKTHVCQQPRPNKLCTRVGPPDRACKAIARAVGGVRNVTCSHPHTCAFQVKAPIQHPSRPGYAFISLCVPDFIGVIFPCRENNLIIANPFYKGVYENDNPEPEVPGDIASNPLCEFPRLDVDALAIDVLGDREKANVCSLPRPAQLCERGKGPADEFCKKIARAVGGTSDASCFRKRTCKFHVKRPVQHPSEPGDAYVSLCVPEFAGVIFPCRENNLVVVDPFFNSIEEEDGGPPTENAPNWDEDFPSNKSTSSVRPTTPRLPTSDTRTSPGNRGDRLFGQYVAHKLTHMDPIQASIAEKLISEVLFEAESGRLNRYWKILEVTPQFPVLPLQPGNSDKVLQLQAPPILVQAQNSSQESDNLKLKTPSPSNHNNPPIIQ